LANECAHCIRAFAFVSRFKTKYHPEECGRRKEEQLQAVNRRCDIFMRLMELGRVDACSLDLDQSDKVIKLLDAGQYLKVLEIVFVAIFSQL
jgi:hypothetical protein